MTAQERWYKKRLVLESARTRLFMLSDDKDVVVNLLVGSAISVLAAAAKLHGELKDEGWPEPDVRDEVLIQYHEEEIHRHEGALMLTQRMLQKRDDNCLT